MSNLSYHVASDKRKWAVVSIVLVVVIAAIVLMPLTDMFTDWNKYCLFGHDYDEAGICTRCGDEKLDEITPDDKKDPEDKKDPAENEPGEEAVVRGGMVANVSSMTDGIMLLSAPMEAQEGVPASEVANSYVLTATITPASADDKTVDWSIRWKNAESEWATGKSVEDYCTITPRSDGDLTATLRNLKDFGEQIEVVVTSRDNPEKQAICLVDYVQKITGFTFDIPDFDLIVSTSFSYQIETSEYTVESDLSVTFGSYMSLTSEFKNAVIQSCADLGVSNMESSLYFMTPRIYKVAPNVQRIGLSVDTTTAERFDGFDTYQPALYTLDSPYNYFITVGEMWYQYTSAKVPLLYQAFKSAVASVSTAHATFDITYTATYEGTTYSSGSKTINVKFDGQALHVPVEDVTMGDDHVLF